MTSTIAPFLTVSELTLAIKRALESTFFQVRVKGEVTNIRQQASGHFYFSLKDSNAQVSAVLFQGAAKGVSKLPKGGDEVIVTGELSLYAPRGTYQIIVRHIEYAGVGELLLKFHELKELLKKRGWFEKEHKKELPKYPKKIGVITSPTGAVIQDIIHILQRRSVGFHLILNPVRVQGEGAAQEIAKAIDQMNYYQLADLLIVGRGGGSLEDLWPFNEECVAKAIFESKIPIISAVGHETDVSLSDFVADLRAPTPSAAAEMAMQTRSSQLDFLLQIKKGISRSLMEKIEKNHLRLSAILRHPLFLSPYHLLGNYLQGMDEIAEEMRRQMRESLDQKKKALSNLKKQLEGLKPSKQLQEHKE
ncbi:MAG: exodeoxyribonuclease VII large subunit, partial [Simkania negevensis]|nr:exodeoxyribonuclease VII large subunit [Simkania negevensis]